MLRNLANARKLKCKAQDFYGWNHPITPKCFSHTLFMPIWSE